MVSQGTNYDSNGSPFDAHGFVERYGGFPSSADMDSFVKEQEYKEAVAALSQRAMEIIHQEETKPLPVLKNSGIYSPNEEVSAPLEAKEAQDAKAQELLHFISSRGYSINEVNTLLHLNDSPNVHLNVVPQSVVQGNKVIVQKQDQFSSSHGGSSPRIQNEGDVTAPRPAHGAGKVITISGKVQKEITSQQMELTCFGNIETTNQLPPRKQDPQFQEKGRAMPLSWKQVVATDPKANADLEFIPPPVQPEANSPKIIKPPMDFLLQSQIPWNTSLMGYFLGSSLPFKLVEDSALKLWGHLGFLKLYMFKKGFYVFKFDSLESRDKVLATGQWQFCRKNIILQRWHEGKKLVKEGLTKMPLWIKLHDIPFSYWSNKGLSYIASGIGKPLQLDALTAKLEPLAFAKILIEVDAAELPPSSLHVAVLNEDAITESLVEVPVEVISKPPHCTHCKIFGHTSVRCPKQAYIPKVWTRPVNSASEKEEANTAQPKPLHLPLPPLQPLHPLEPQKPTSPPLQAQPQPKKLESINSEPLPPQPPQPPQPAPSDSSTPPPTALITRLKTVDEIEKKKQLIKAKAVLSITEVDEDGFQTVLHKKNKKGGSNSPRTSPT